jgi:hypothetical protein
MDMVVLVLPQVTVLVLLVQLIQALVVTVVVTHNPEVLEAQVSLLCVIQIHMMQHYQQQALPLSQ